MTPDLSDPEASVRVVVGDLESPDDVGSGGHGDDITVDLEGGANTVTVIVTAENGYHDRVYSFAITRTTPVDAELAGLGLRTKRDAEAGSEGIDQPGVRTCKDRVYGDRAHGYRFRHDDAGLCPGDGAIECSSRTSR